MAERRKSVLLTLIRRGETTWELEGRLHGRTDLPLSPAGSAAVTADAERMGGEPPSIIFHPPDEAAAETARAVAVRAGAKLKPVADLAEVDLGLLDGLTRQAFADRFPSRYRRWLEDPIALAPPDGEVAADGRSRVLGACGRLLRRARSDHVGVVLPPLCLGFMRCWLADLPTTELWSLLEERPRIERYVLALELVARLEKGSRELIGN